jgi:hypothetical protein
MYKSWYVRFKFFMAVVILLMFFWVKSPCGLVGGSQRFGEAEVNFGPEDINSPLLQNIGFYQPIHTAT